MKILHIVSLGPFDRLGIPGPCNVALQECRALQVAGHEVEILTSHSVGPRVRDEEVDGVRVRSFRRVQFCGSLSTVWSTGLVWATLRESNAVQVLHLHASRDLIFVAILSLVRRARIVCQPHGQVLARGTIRFALDRLFIGPLLNRAQAVLALQSNEKRRLVAIGVDQRKMLVMGNKTHMSDLKPRHEFIDKGPSILGFIAHLRPEKRVDIAVQLSESLSELGFPHRLLIAGPDGGSLPTIRAAIGENSPVSYVGVLDRNGVQSLIARCSILIFTSNDEPFGMSLVEGMAAGVPVLCGPGIHVAAGLNLQGEGVLHLDPNNLEQTAARVAALLQDEVQWRTAGELARKHAEGNFDARRYASELSTVYERVVQ